jgi:hypothetical protein
MATKHTPGPWVFTNMAKSGSVIDPDYEIQDSDERSQIASINWSTHPDEKHISKEKARYNAKLIAAAPELLEALRELLNIIGPLGTTNMTEPQIDKLIINLMNNYQKGIKAIKKAEGE